jgi:hypothetical protein
MGTPHRMNRDEFFGRISPLEPAGLRSVLWTLYWRGDAAMRERIETELAVIRHGAAARKAAAPVVDPGQVRLKVQDFVELARSGAYFAGSRAVSPKERTRWRFTFKALADEVQRALRSPEPDEAFPAAEQLIELARDMNDTYYFRSEDPVEAARFVVSEMAAVLWTAVLRRSGFTEFAGSAARQLIRWESRYGWTRYGSGAVATKEELLADVVSGILPSPDAWNSFADAYLRALDGISAATAARTGRKGNGASPSGEAPGSRASRLARWHAMVVDRLMGGEREDLVDRLLTHPAISGVETEFVRAQWESRRGNLAAAKRTIQACLRKAPRHAEFLEFAVTIGAAPAT